MLKAVNIYVAYDPVDKSHFEKFLKSLNAVLADLRKQKLVDIWHEGEIRGGEVIADEIARHLNSTNLVLLLISADFLASVFMNNDSLIDMLLECHQAGTKMIVPILMRPTNWEYTSLGKLQPLPKSGKALASGRSSLDEGLAEVAKDVRIIVEQLLNLTSSPQIAASSASSGRAGAAARIRLQQELEHLQQEYSAYGEKLAFFRQRQVRETDAGVLFKLSQDISDIEKERDKLLREIASLEEQLGL